MPQAASLVDMAYEWELWIGRTQNETTTWTQILGFEALEFPDQTPEKRDVTHMQSPGRTREVKPGMLPHVEWSQEKQIWNGHAGDTLILTLAALTKAGTPETVLFEFNARPDGTSAHRYTWSGYVDSYVPTGTVGENEMANLALVLMAAQATNPRVIPE